DKGNKVEPQIVDMWREASLQRDELARQLSQKEPASPPAAPQQPDVLAILARVKELQGDPFVALERLKALIPKTPEAKHEPAANPLTAVKETVALLLEVKELIKGDAAAAVTAAVRGDGDGPWWRDVIPKIPSTLNAIGSLVGMFIPGAR